MVFRLFRFVRTRDPRHYAIAIYSNACCSAQARNKVWIWLWFTFVRRHQRSYILLCYSIMLNVKNAKMCLKAPCNSSSFILSDVYRCVCVFLLFVFSVLFLFFSQFVVIAVGVFCFARFFCAIVLTKDLSFWAHKVVIRGSQKSTILHRTCQKEFYMNLKTHLSYWTCAFECVHNTVDLL